MSDFRFAASLVVPNNGEVLLAQRSLDKTHYPGAWSLPSTYVREEDRSFIETRDPDVAREQLIRAVRRKLKVEVELDDVIGSVEGFQSDYFLLMIGFRGRIVRGDLEPNIVDYIGARFSDPYVALGENPELYCAQVLMKKLDEETDYLG